MSKRIYMNKVLARKKENSHGSCRFEDCNPDLFYQYKIPNLFFTISFEEAHRLLLSIQSLLLSVNRYDRRSKEVRNIGLKLSCYLNTNTIAVYEDAIDKTNADIKEQMARDYKQREKERKKRQVKIG